VASPAGYEPVYSDFAAEFIVSLPRRRARRALRICRTLAKNPFLVSDFTVNDAAGRPIDHLLVEGFILTYYVDHASRSVFISEIETAD
jgi:hypothetical protein